MKIFRVQANRKPGPHLIIGFKMYSDSLRFNGYDQPDIEDWVKNQTEEFVPMININWTSKTGTLLIQFFDRRQKQIRLARIRHKHYMAA
jgi:hypothetical protein